MSVACILRDGPAEYEIHYGTPEWHASMEWARFHGLDPNRIPAESVVERDEAGCRILFTEFVMDGPDVADIAIVDGEAQMVGRIEQGEAPPLPFPREVTG